MSIMSLSQESSGYISNNTQGKIHTENADLISLLTENSSDSLINRPGGQTSQRSDKTLSVNKTSNTPLDQNNNSKSEPDSGTVKDTVRSNSEPDHGSDSSTRECVSSKTPDNRVETDRDSFPKPKPSALLPSARGPSADIGVTGRTSSSSVVAIANPDILRASGITPAQPNQYLPRYVSLKSSFLTTPQTSTASVAAASPVAEGDSEEGEEEGEEEVTPRNSPEREVASPETKSHRKSPTLISADSLEFNEGDLDKYFSTAPSEKTVEETDKENIPLRTPSIVIQENTFESKPEEINTVRSVDKNLLQPVPSSSGYQLKSHNPASSESFERDSLSSSVNVEEKKSARTNESAASQRSRVFVVRNENTMSGSRNRKVYVESPTFTKDEEDEYRFVSSRIDEYNDMNDTYRQLDENTVEEKPKKKSSGKRVRYQDTDRFEDKNQLDLDEEVGFIPNSGPSNDVTPKSALKNSPGIGYTQSPAKGLTLPDGPLDPKEEEELERESVYQHTLKQRIHENKLQLEVENIPRLPLSPDTSRDFVQDSLDTAGEEYNQRRGSKARDSLELYQDQTDRSRMSKYGEMENTTWHNPPPQPFSGPASLQPQPEDSLNQGQFQRHNALDGYSSEPDYRHQQRREEYDYPEPQSGHYSHGNERVLIANQQSGYQSHYANPQQFPTSSYYDYCQDRTRKNPHISSFLPEDRGVNQSYDSEVSYRPSYEHSQSNQNGGYAYYDNGAQDQGSYNRPEMAGGFSNPEGHIDRFVNEDVESGMEMANPARPRYNYISNNKIDYGRPPPKSYKQIKDIKSEEKARAESLFVKPKVKPKEAPAGHSSARTVNSFDEHSDSFPKIGVLKQKPASAEDLWAQRAANLQQRSSGKNGKKKKPGAKLVKYPSENGIAVHQQIHRAPMARPAYLPAAAPPPAAAPAPVVGSPSNSYGSHSFPSSPTRRPLDLKPITHEVITADGQRISVDVNLKLMSPPPHHFNSDGNLPAASHYVQDVTDPAPVGHQYPIMDYRGPQEYPEAYSDSYPALAGGQGYNSGQQGFGSGQQGYGGGQQGYGGGQQGYGVGQGYSGSQDYGSGQQNYMIQPQESSGRLSESAYPKIPPIPSSTESKHSHPRSEVEDGYVAQFRKQREKRDHEEQPWYKVYGINDYRKMQKEVRLGALGPDLDNDSYRERLEKVQRQSQYARMVMEKNKHVPQKKTPSFPKPKDQDDIMNKRKVAIEYAKSVPKPTTKPIPNPYNSYEVASQMSGHGPSPTAGHKQRYKQPVVDVIDLDKLQQRHERDKQNVAKIRENMNGTVAQNA